MAECTHSGAILIGGGGTINALEGDFRIPRAWCPSCGAIEVQDYWTRARSWVFPKGEGS